MVGSSLENNILFDAHFIDFVRDAEDILAQYAEQCIHYHADQRVGEKHWANEAKQNMTIITYRNRSDIDVQFDDGTVREHVSYAQFLCGSIALHARKKHKQ